MQSKLHQSPWFTEKPFLFCAYLGAAVPGFPWHPNRRFKTVTIVRKGLIDHKDSCSAAAQLQETADTGLFAANDPLASLPDSWAAQPATNVAIWTLRMAPSAHRTLSAAQGENARASLYFFKGACASISGQAIDAHAALDLRASQEVALVNNRNEVA